MKIAVTSQNRRTVTNHAGRCRNFWIFNIDNDKIVDKTLLELPREQSFHESHGMVEHPLDAVDVLIVGGMGAGLAKRLQRRGIKGIVTTESDPEEAVKSYLDGSLEITEPGSHECRNHKH